MAHAKVLLVEHLSIFRVQRRKQREMRTCARILEKFVPQFGIETGQKVLDVGTGTEVLIQHLVRIVGPTGSVIAIDWSEKMVQVCKAKHSQIKDIS